MDFRGLKKSYLEYCLIDLAVRTIKLTSNILIKSTSTPLKKKKKKKKEKKTDTHDRSRMSYLKDRSLT